MMMVKSATVAHQLDTPSEEQKRDRSERMQAKSKTSVYRDESSPDPPSSADTSDESTVPSSLSSSPAIHVKGMIYNLKNLSRTSTHETLSSNLNLPMRSQKHISSASLNSVTPLPHMPTDVIFHPPDRHLAIIDTLSSLIELGVLEWDIWNEELAREKEPEEHPFEIRDAGMGGGKSKGMGMFATRDIKRGEIVVQERPLYVTRLDIDGTGQTEREALKELNEKTRTKFLGLSNAQAEGVDNLAGILLTNTFPVDFDSDSSDSHLGGGVYEFICRANQDCTPSTHYHFHYPSFTGRLFAVRPISKGEEISVSYAPLARGREKRKQVLSRKYGFECDCEACGRVGDQGNESDVRRERVKKFVEFCEGGGLPSWPMLVEVLEDVTKEGLVAYEARVYMSGAEGLDRAKQYEVGLEWIEKAKELYGLIEGMDSANLKKAEKMEQKMIKSRDTRVAELLAFASRPNSGSNGNESDDTLSDCDTIDSSVWG